MSFRQENIDNNDKSEFIDILNRIGTKTGHIRIKKDTKTNSYYLSWCVSVFNRTGLGNRLEQYWLGRALAFWFNLKFKFNERCTCKNTDYYFCRKRDKQNRFYFYEWTQFLPHKSTLTINKLYQSLKRNNLNITYENIWIDTINEMSYDQNITKYLLNNPNAKSLESQLLDLNNDWNITELNQSLYRRNNAKGESYWFQYFNHFILYYYNKETNYHLYLPMGRDIYVSIVNQLFVEIIRNEMKLAFYLYFQQRYQYKHIMNEYQFIYNVIDSTQKHKILSIHYRCGDKFKWGGFLGLSYYRDVIKSFNLDTTINKKSKISAYFLMQLDKNKSRPLDLPYIDECNQLLNILLPHFKQIFNKTVANFYVIKNGTVTSDMYFISHSDYIIGRGSTFYMLGSLGNRNNVVMIKNEYLKNNVVFKDVFPANIINLDTKTYVTKWNRFHKSVQEIASLIINS